MHVSPTGNELLAKTNASVRCTLTMVIFMAVLNWKNLAAQTSFEIPTKRLSGLEIENPTGYRDLAEELSQVTGSQPAKDLTIRLYLICAANSEGKLRRSAMRGLIHSARDDQERQRFKVLSFLLDPAFSDIFDQRSFGTVRKIRQNKVVSESNTPRQKVLDALYSIRQGKTLRAKRIMENAEVQEYFRNFESILSLKQFNEACVMSDLPNSVLLKILQMDLKIRGEDSGLPDKPIDGATQAWRQLFKNKLPDRIPKLNLANVTEFDPAKSLFQNGVWRKPPR